MKFDKMLITAFTLLLVVCAVSMLTACDFGTTENTSDTLPESATNASAESVTEELADTAADPTTDTPAEDATEPPTEVPTEASTETVTEGISLNVKTQDLEDMMQSVFAGSIVQNETVMFLDKGEEKTLLYNIDEVISVTSYDERKTYVEGKDYAVVNGKLVCLEGSSIPCITSDKFYNFNPPKADDKIIQVKHDGKICDLYWGEATAMTQWQVKVSYTHSDSYTGFLQPSEAITLKPFLEKLKNGEDITIIFYGDSITYGANASFIVGGGTNQMPYTILFTKAVADLFGYNVHFVKTGLKNTPAVPADYETGAQGTITYINPSVGGWTTQNGLQNYDTYVKPFIEQYGCDLFMLAFGMNDGGSAPKSVWRTQTQMLDRVVEQAPDVNLLVMATMVPNPDGIGWYGNQVKQEPVLMDGVKSYNENGIPAACVRMTSISLAVLERKLFRDYTSNNVNHPNDFFSRIYAQTLLQCVVGYENMK